MANAGAGVPATRRGGVRLGIVIASAVIVLLFASANFLVLDYSIRQANDFVAETEKTLVKSEFRNQIEQVVLYQSGLSVWDKSFDELANGRLGEDFVRRDLRDWLWRESGFSWLVFARPSGETVLAMHNGIVVPGEEADGVRYWMSDLVKRATENYYAALRRTRDGWIVAKSMSNANAVHGGVPQISATGMRVIEQVMSIVVVQAVVPRRLFIPDDRRSPVLMITVKPITASMLADSERRLGLTGLGFSPITTDDANLLTTGVGGDAYNPMVASWHPNRPGSFVWTMAVPHIAALIAIFVVVMGFGALKFSSLVRALERSEAKNAHLARHDALTGVLSRSGFDLAVTDLSSKGQRTFSIIAIDLDRFKAVNDRHGHAAGDEVLRVMASRFMARLGDRGVVARLGGDEFAVLLPGIADRDVTLPLAEAFVRDAQVPVPFQGQLLQLGGSAGIGAFPEHGRTPHAIMLAADAALYAAKHAGRNCAHYGVPGGSDAASDIEAA
ncbi:diguanylate cyclase (GGDEF)-like protein [Rhizobium azooxidifex]|uniref:Diguanylate cyclase (GGDEF)-like protein n=1 Tax=Mycoplana azooxidifex TaxID=1636188 RepID=A0A7W6GHH0_9HYPH|nr:diguanylate cyclase [Mycoplana azooxidifex]MBB3975107.1 diguanylate cyclase (GGDEF)-like protein [Mycoplana azooxidifex]